GHCRHVDIRRGHVRAAGRGQLDLDGDGAPGLFGVCEIGQDNDAVIDHLGDGRRGRAGVEVAVAAGVGGGDGVAAHGQGRGGEGGLGHATRSGQRSCPDSRAVVVEGYSAGGRAAPGGVGRHGRREGDGLAKNRRVVRGRRRDRRGGGVRVDRNG